MPEKEGLTFGVDSKFYIKGWDPSSPTYHEIIQISFTKKGTDSQVNIFLELITTSPTG